MADSLSVSGTTNPYQKQSYTVGSNDKNTLTITSYFKLLAAQLQYQDMSNPMDNSEMMAQMTQMAMVQSMSAMTESIQTSSAISTSVYASGLMGKDVTVVITETQAGVEVPVNVKYGKVESVNLTGSSPSFKLEGDDKEYPLSYLLGMGRIDNPYKDKDKDKDEDANNGTNGEGTNGGNDGGTNGVA